MQTSQTELSLLEEATWSVVPSPAAFQALRITGESFKIGRENVVSDELRPDGNISDLIQVGGDALGGIEAEMSYGTFDKLIESALRSAFSLDVIENGITEKSFQIQKKQQGNGDTPTYELYAGQVVDTLTININAKQKTTISVTFAGKDGTISEAITGTVAAAGTGVIFDGSNSFSLTNAFDVSPVPKLMSMTININNSLAGKPIAGDTSLFRISNGRCNVSGTANFYFQNKQMMDKFLAGTAGSIEIELGSVTNEKYTIEIPTAKIQDTDHFSAGNDDDVMQAVTWQGLYDSSNGSTIKITRAVA